MRVRLEQEVVVALHSIGPYGSSSPGGAPPRAFSACKRALSRLSADAAGDHVTMRAWRLRSSVLSYACLGASALGFAVATWIVMSGIVSSRYWVGGWLHVAIVVLNSGFFFFMGGGLRALVLPSWVAMDANGLAIAGRMSCRAVRWGEVAWARFGPYGTSVGLTRGGSLAVRFMSLADPALKEVREGIVAGAHLELATEEGPTRYYRREDFLPPVGRARRWE